MQAHRVTVVKCFTIVKIKVQLLITPPPLEKTPPGQWVVS